MLLKYYLILQLHEKPLNYEKDLINNLMLPDNIFIST